MPKRRSGGFKLQRQSDSKTLSFSISKVKPNKVKVGIPLALSHDLRLKNYIDTPQQQGLISSLITKVINNLQVTVRNIHIRYEDKLSVPGVCIHSPKSSPWRSEP